MKVLIVSDSHGYKKELELIKERHRHEVEAMIHCGDSELTSDSPELKDFVVVKGNMDYAAPDLPTEVIELIGDTVFYVTHGHLMDVKMSLVSLTYRTEETGAKIACFGHSHTAHCFEQNGHVYINPGSIRMPRERFEKTYAICEVQGSSVTVSYLDLEGQEVSDLRREFQIS
ncbi:metallophosphoesterase [Fictibacillus enclensis]|uniref:metallophosphoesterase family protein n=1 Tax=Fictibacillus enclensis TaxID=1017270 RepID=UPI0025A03ECD|nr:metallophosphoesterase [Fictibacillus enclensis]MDM5339299.1 metallophosphoesterase [Fictibacillus enclensis]